MDTLKYSDFKFSSSKPFYPYVLNYMITIHGLAELVARKFILTIKKSKRNGMTLNDIIIKQQVVGMHQEAFVTDVFENNLEPTNYIGELGIKSEYHQNHITISMDDISALSNETVNNHMLLYPAQAKASGVLIIMGYELTKDRYDVKDEVWNFFYHCRNAIAHGGIFDIQRTNRFPAKWGNLEITQSMNGTNLFKTHIQDPNGLLSIGDPLCLLYDIEQKYIID